jgi:hypothetical protein
VAPFFLFFPISILLGATPMFQRSLALTAIKLQHTIKNKTMNASGESLYWYAPEVKYFVKCEYDTSYWIGVTDWELISFKLNK